jgi:glycosyltransferase involved in cell wall biosynthesis
MKISVITVCFNSAEHIADALASVDAQTWPVVEHLIIDGGSRDGTLRIVQAHARPWRRIVSEPDDGIYDAMNKGIRLAAGDVVGFINSDDFYPGADVLATVARCFERDPALEACYGDLCYVQPDRIDSVVRYWRAGAFEPGAFRRAWAPPHPTLFVRREVYRRLGGFDLSYRIAADTELMIRLLEVHRIAIAYLPQVLVHMRTGGTTNRSLRNVWRQNVEIWRALKQHGQQPSLPTFVGGKLWSRSRQFVMRPA